MSETKYKEFWLFKNGTGCADPDYQSAKPDVTLIDDFIHVVEISALLEEKQKVDNLIVGLQLLYAGVPKDAQNFIDQLIKKYGDV